jgi:tripartite-type tricarboxylate transporter receptor subunit TctC
MNGSWLLRTCLVAAVATAFAVPIASAQPATDFPNAPVKIVVPFAAGGPTGVVARILGEAFQDRVKNRGINVYGNKPAELSNGMANEIARWREVAKAANIRAE